MLFLRSYFRHLLKNKLYTLVTIVGFAISLTFIILLSVYIKNELSIDNFQVNKDRIYRIESEVESDFSGPIAADLKNKYPDIESYTRIYDQSAIATVTDGEKFNLNFLAVDPAFFNIFSYPLLSSNSNEVLVSPANIVLSESYARKLFGAHSPIGKKVLINTNNEFTVSGIMKDFPENTVFKSPDALINIKAMSKITGWDEFLTEIGFCSMDIYFLESKNGNLPAKTPEILNDFKKNFWMYKEGEVSQLFFTPLKEVYFSSKTGHFVKGNSKNLILILAIIVLTILILAIGNYVNLTVAQATFRAKEIAIKKLIGSSGRVLFIQLIKESFLSCAIALAVSLILAKLAEPVFNSLLQTKLELDRSITAANLLLLILLLVLTGFVSGIIPALRIIRFKPIDIVKGTFRKNTKTLYSKTFITFQYVITIVLLVCSLVIIKQTRFLKNYNLGFDKENIIHLPYLSDGDKKAAIKAALSQIPGVEVVSITWGSPLDGGSNQTFDYNNSSVSFQEFRVDSAFFKVFDIAVEPTKNAYSKDGIFLNKRALKVLDTKTPPATLKVNNHNFPILGVVNDFHFNDLRKNIGALMIHPENKESFATNIFLKLGKTNYGAILKKIKSVYTPLIDDAPFDITFVDQTVDNWYKKEERTGKIIGYFTLLSFVISFMGILAMATFYTQQHKKEIGIRKVNGASNSQVFAFLNRNFLKWIVPAFVIAVPLSWYFMNRWLENFAYKTALSWWVFALSGLLAFTIALLSVSWQSIRAAKRNPVEALRDE